MVRLKCEKEDVVGKDWDPGTVEQDGNSLTWELILQLYNRIPLHCLFVSLPKKFWNLTILG